LSESLFIVSKAIVFFALSTGPAALVSAVLEGTQVVYAICFGWILTLVYPRIFQEDISRVGLVQKSLVAGALLFGVWLVQA